MSPLTSSNFVSGVLTAMGSDGGKPAADHMLSSRSTGKAWPGLGKRVDVLRLPAKSADVERDMGQLSI